MPDLNLNRIISEAARKLEAVGIDAGAAEAEIILCELLDLDRLQLFLEGREMIDADLVDSFDNIIKRRLTRYPLQYILGSAWFFGRKFLVNESVMVPCPETELLLDSVLRAARFCSSEPVSLLDIGTGSGVVSVSAIQENPKLMVTATDISPEALDVARENAARFEVENQIDFIRSDLFENINREARFDIIASNPPYIAEGDYSGLPPEVKADPKESLLAGVKGMDIIERLIAEAPDYLCRPGFLIFEIGYDQSEIIFDRVNSDKRYSDCSLLKDLAGIDRIVIAKVKKMA